MNCTAGPLAPCALEDPDQEDDDQDDQQYGPQTDVHTFPPFGRELFSARSSRQTSERRDKEEDSRCELRLEDMRVSIALRLLIAALTVFALLAALVELLAGRRPILVGGTGKVIASRAALGRA